MRASDQVRCGASVPLGEYEGTSAVGGGDERGKDYSVAECLDPPHRHSQSCFEWLGLC